MVRGKNSVKNLDRGKLKEVSVKMWIEYNLRRILLKCRLIKLKENSGKTGDRGKLKEDSGKNVDR